MKIEDGKFLLYLHDAIFFDLRYDAKLPDTRTLTIMVQCNPDTGYEPWNNVTLRFFAKDVFLFRCTAWGYVFGQDTIDSWHEGVSKGIVSELGRLEAQGARLPGRFFTIVLHSGSCIELACDSLDVEECDLPPKNCTKMNEGF